MSENNYNLLLKRKAEARFLRGGMVFEPGASGPKPLNLRDNHRFNGARVRLYSERGNTQRKTWYNVSHIASRSIEAIAIGASFKQ